MQSLQQFDKSVSDIVRADYRTADVFKKYGINYCCGGQVTLEQACELKGVERELVVADLAAACRIVSLSNNLLFGEWTVDFLVDYILNVHHAYLKLTIPALEINLLSFVNSHQKQHPELSEILAVFRDLVHLISLHSQHEEEIIFPYIKQIDNTYRRKESYGNLFVRTLRKPLGNLETEHRKIGGLLSRIRALTNNYQFPENACTNHRVVFLKLQEFDNDLVQHKHLENNILFPKAVEIEKELLQG